MTKCIQVNGWSSLSPDKQDQIREWITQILSAKLAAQKLLEFLSQNNDAFDDSKLEFMKALRNTTNSDFEVTDTALEGALDVVDFCEIVCTTVCGQNGNCYRECRKVCS